MSSNEAISRQISTALEMKKQEIEFQKSTSEAPLEMVTRENKVKLNNIEVANLRSKALRRATIRRQGSSFNLDKFEKNLLKPSQEVVDEQSELQSSYKDDTDSSNTVLDGEIVPKRVYKSAKLPLPGSARTSQKSSSANDYHLTKAEKQKVQEETTAHINSIIKEAKKAVRQTNTFFLAKYGKPEAL